MIDITMFLELLIKAVFAGVGVFLTWAVKTYVIPYVQAKFTPAELENIKNYASMMIKAAEQLESNGVFDELKDFNEQKKEYVLKAVKARVESWGYTFSEEEISDIIEGLIKEVKVQK